MRFDRHTLGIYRSRLRCWVLECDGRMLGAGRRSSARPTTTALSSGRWRRRHASHIAHLASHITDQGSQATVHGSWLMLCECMMQRGQFERVCVSSRGSGSEARICGPGWNVMLVLKFSAFARRTGARKPLRATKRSQAPRKESRYCARDHHAPRTSNPILKPEPLDLQPTP